MPMSGGCRAVIGPRVGSVSAGEPRTARGPGRLRSRASMATMVPSEDEQLFTLPQTGKARDLRPGCGGVLGKDVASLGRDDPASARLRHDAQARRLHRTGPCAHLRLSVPSGGDDCGPCGRGSGGSSEMLRILPGVESTNASYIRASHPSDLAPRLANGRRRRFEPAGRACVRRHIDREEAVRDLARRSRPYAGVGYLCLLSTRWPGRHDGSGTHDVARTHACTVATRAEPAIPPSAVGCTWLGATIV